MIVSLTFLFIIISASSSDDEGDPQPRLIDLSTYELPLETRLCAHLCSRLTLDGKQRRPMVQQFSIDDNDFHFDQFSIDGNQFSIDPPDWSRTTRTYELDNQLFEKYEHRIAVYHVTNRIAVPDITVVFRRTVDLVDAFSIIQSHGSVPNYVREVYQDIMEKYFDNCTPSNNYKLRVTGDDLGGLRAMEFAEYSATGGRSFKVTDGDVFNPIRTFGTGELCTLYLATVICHNCNQATSSAAMFALSFVNAGSELAPIAEVLNRIRVHQVEGDALTRRFSVGPNMGTHILYKGLDHDCRSMFGKAHSIVNFLRQ